MIDRKGERLVRPSKWQGIPFIDPAVEHVGVSKLRSLNASNLGQVNKTLVIQDNDKPLAVMMNYKQYLEIQTRLQEALDRVELLSQEEVHKGFQEGLQDIKEGRTIALGEVDPFFKK